MRRQTLHLGLLAGALVWLTPSAARGQESINGVWRVSRIELDYESTPNLEPLSSLIIFTCHHYSMIWMPGNEGMREFAERWTPTDEEKIKRFGELIVNAGRYTVDDRRLEVRPVVARDPDFVNGRMIFDYRWSGDDLVLTWVDEYSFDDVQHPLIEQFGGKEHMTLSKLEELPSEAQCGENRP